MIRIRLSWIELSWIENTITNSPRFKSFFTFFSIDKRALVCSRYDSASGCSGSIFKAVLKSFEAFLYSFLFAKAAPLATNASTHVADSSKEAKR